MKARLINRVSAVLRIDLRCPGDCPLDTGEYKWGHQNCREIPMAVDDARLETWGRHLSGPNAAPREEWPTHCRCGAPLDFDKGYQGCGVHWRYDTESGKPEPGDLYWTPPYEQASNLGPAGPHLIGVLPSGESWDIDGPSHWEGKLGAGWTRTGEPPNVTATPSIMTRSYHGFLQNGEWTADLEGRTYPLP